MGDSATKMYQRLDIHQRGQHFLMVTSFLMCAVTGIPIKFAFTSWAQSFAKIFGNFEILFGIHKLGAMIMLMSAVYHVSYLIVHTFKRQLRCSMLPVIKDFRDFGHSFAYYCGVTKNKPQFHKYSFKEKMDYWAVYWGTPIMLGTGLILWFPGRAAELMPQWVIHSAHYIHEDEAMLAILFIFAIHFYNVHFSPDFFPMNKVWLTGKVSREVMEHEYPLELFRIEGEEGLNYETVKNAKTVSRILLVSEIIIYAAILIGVIWYFLPQTFI